VELVGDVEGELEVLVGDRIVEVDRPRRGERLLHRALERLEELLAQGAPRRG
jgi:hypothetical protein